MIICPDAPGDPVIHLNASGDALVEGMFLRLNCTVVGGNPTPDIVWKRDGLPLSGGRVSQQFGSTSGIVVVLLSREDHRANYTCHISSEAMQTPKAISEVINVQCKWLS